MRGLTFIGLSPVWCAAVAAVVGWSGCARDGAGCATPLGAVTSDEIALELSPDLLVIRDRIEVHWWPGDPVPRIARHAWEGTLEGLSIVEDGGVIYIEDFNRCAWARRMDAIPRVDLMGLAPPHVLLESQADFIMEGPWVGGNLSIEGDEMAGNLHLQFLGDSLRLRLPNGIGHATVEGEAVRFSTFRGGFGDLEATALDAQQVLAHHGGVGEMKLRPEGYLFLELAGAGDVHLMGPGAERDIHILPGAAGEVIELP